MRVASTGQCLRGALDEDRGAEGRCMNVGAVVSVEDDGATRLANGTAAETERGSDAEGRVVSPLRRPGRYNGAVTVTAWSANETGAEEDSDLSRVIQSAGSCGEELAGTGADAGRRCTLTGLGGAS